MQGHVEAFTTVADGCKDGSSRRYAIEVSRPRLPDPELRLSRARHQRQVRREVISETADQCI